MDATAQKIAELNDKLRMTFNPLAGKIMVTSGVNHLEQGDRQAIIRLVQTFNDFNADNDPHGEHDFGQVVHNGQKAFFKIDYYDTSLQWASPDPTDPSLTIRVMTIMLAHEH